MRYSISTANKTNAKPQPKNIIHAKLIFELPKPAVVKQPEPSPEPIVPEPIVPEPILPEPIEPASIEPPLVNTDKPKPPIEPVSKETKKTEPAPTQDKPNKAPQATADQAPKPIAPIQQSPEPTITKPVQPAKNKAQDPKPAAINSQFTGTAGKHVQALNLQQDALMAEQARRYFNQQKNSPTLDSNSQDRSDRFYSEDEKLLNKTKVRANCDGVTRKTTAILLGFMGAKIDCTGKPDINTYINKHVNKEQLLDAKYKKPQRLHKKPLAFKD